MFAEGFGNIEIVKPRLDYRLVSIPVEDRNQNRTVRRSFLVQVFVKIKKGKIEGGTIINSNVYINIVFKNDK